MSVGEFDQLLQLQWTTYRGWVEFGGVLDAVDDESVLRGWTVRDLIAHTGRTFMAIVATTPAPDAAPQTIYRYMANYPSAASEIAEGTRQLSTQIADDLLGGIDDCAESGFAALTRLTTSVVRAPRGPITRDDFVITRIAELVVHGDDLARSVPTADPAPLDEAAIALVSTVLADGYTAKSGAQRPAVPDIEWIRLATGRAPSTDPALPLL
jgi:uncharacterized protein (TIGR03083 family)